MVGCHQEFNNGSLGLGKLQHYSSSDVNPIKLLKTLWFFKAAGFTYGPIIIAKELTIHRRPNYIACDYLIPANFNMS